MKIKIKDALRLVDSISTKIKVTENFVLNNTLAPHDIALEELSKLRELLSASISKLNSLYAEKYALLSVVKDKCAEVGIKTNGADMSYSSVELELDKVSNRLLFLSELMQTALKTDLCPSDKMNYISAMPSNGILNDIYSLDNVKTSLLKQLDDLQVLAEIEVDVGDVEVTPAADVADSPTATN